MTRAALQRRVQKAEDLMQRAGESIVFQRQMIITLERAGHDVKAAKMFLKWLSPSKLSSLPSGIGCSSSWQRASNAPSFGGAATVGSWCRSSLMADQTDRAARLLVRALFYATDGERCWYCRPI